MLGAQDLHQGFGRQDAEQSLVGVDHGDCGEAVPDGDGGRVLLIGLRGHHRRDGSHQSAHWGVRR